MLISLMKEEEIPQVAALEDVYKRQVIQKHLAFSLFVPSFLHFIIIKRKKQPSNKQKIKCLKIKQEYQN